MSFDAGKAGEAHIAKLMKKKGYRILEKNYHSRFGEIDIIGENRQYIVFVEVKTRKQNSMVTPWEAITPAKQQRIILTAEAYLASHPTEAQPRFDAAAVYLDGEKILGEEYLENAFCL